MDIDPGILEKLKSMDGQELSDKISEISRILGANEKMIRRMVGNPEQIQRKIGDLSDADIRRLMSKVKPSQLDAIKKTLR